eukprot:TRINITY_DN67527_c0_g1_i1.p1 TRINITY_DN67527_c0_g1~~TRINITY_DN67527_c0_g1_i1.p1  ORF type:complete len:245 (-),score=32.04 TRINITY_DN67527_c0_g1_i1:123-857(-)
MASRTWAALTFFSHSCLIPLGSSQHSPTLEFSSRSSSLSSTPSEASGGRGLRTYSSYSSYRSYSSSADSSSTEGGFIDSLLLEVLFGTIGLIIQGGLIVLSMYVMKRPDLHQHVRANTRKALLFGGVLGFFVGSAAPTMLQPDSNHNRDLLDFIVMGFIALALAAGMGGCILMVRRLRVLESGVMFVGQPPPLVIGQPVQQQSVLQAQVVSAGQPEVVQATVVRSQALPGQNDTETNETNQQAN